MIFRTRRQARFSKLRNGEMFLYFEAYPLSEVPFKTCSYMRQLIRERRAELNEYIRGGATKSQWRQHIKDKYNENKWLKRDRVGMPVADPWKMLRDFEDSWRQQFPQYESPWQPRRRDFRDFVRRTEQQLSERKLGERRGYLQA